MSQTHMEELNEVINKSDPWQGARRCKNLVQFKDQGLGKLLDRNVNSRHYVQYIWYIRYYIETAVFCYLRKLIVLFLKNL